MAVTEVEARPNLPKGGLPSMKELRQLMNLVDRDDPDPTHIAELHQRLEDVPELWRVYADLSYLVRQQITDSLLGSHSLRITFQHGYEAMRVGLGYEYSSQLERLLIDHVLICWLRLQQVEMQLTSAVTGSHTHPQGDYWDRRLSAAQRRYLRASETLARVRKLIRRTPALQVNIAAEGGQQVNVVEVRGGKGHNPQNA